MEKRLLKNHVRAYLKKIQADPEMMAPHKAERRERCAYYRAWTPDRLVAMNLDQFTEYLSKLYAMIIWGNKQYVINKLIKNNGFESLKKELAAVIWEKAELKDRWDAFRSSVKGIGPAMVSEILCYVHPTEFLAWNRRSYVGLRYLGVDNLPRYNYQITGERYQELCETGKIIAAEMEKQGMKDVDLLAVDYFIWDELQVETNMSQIYKKVTPGKPLPAKEDPDSPESIARRKIIHDEIRDKLADIGHWLGFRTFTETKVAEDAPVDTLWESNIGNMGRVLYVFEVHTEGNLDALLLHLLKALNTTEVHGVVAVTSAEEIDTLKKHAASVQGLGDKLKYWEYKDVLQVHAALEAVNESINRLGLVP